MHSTDIEYVHEGIRLIGRLVVDDDTPGPRPAVLIAHDAAGLGELPRETARRLAELGYVAFALDYYGDGALLPPDRAHRDHPGDADLRRGVVRPGGRDDRR